MYSIMDEEKTKQNERQKFPRFGIALRLFVALAAALFAFGGIMIIAMRFVFPRYGLSDRRGGILTPESLLEAIEVKAEENPGDTVEEILAAIRAEHENEISDPSFFRMASNFLSYILLMVVSLFVIIGYIYARTFTKPLRKLNESARRVAALDFNFITEFSERGDEIGELSRSLNLMTDRLKGALDELTEKNAVLTTELEHEKDMENRRRQFLSDVSHELKTPLAIIGGYAEALAMGVKPETKAKRYCEVINEETDKMTRLLNELMKLSRFEAEGFTLNPRTFDMGALIDDVGKKYEGIFKKNGIRYIANAGGGELLADPDRIEQVVSNFLNNAVSHAADEKIVLLNCRASNGACDFSIVNSGEHIADEDINNIWTPFYRADKARGREEGHFGLGLAIVRALLERHGAEFGVRNVENVSVENKTGGNIIIKTGVEFWFRI